MIRTVACIAVKSQAVEGNFPRSRLGLLAGVVLRWGRQLPPNLGLAPQNVT